MATKPPVLKPTIPPLLVLILDASLLIGGAMMPHWLLGAILGGSLFWFVVAAVSVRKNALERWPKLRPWFPFLDPDGGMARQSELMDTHVQGLTFRLVDMAIDYRVVGRTIENCVIHGPAIIAGEGLTEFRHCNGMDLFPAPSGPLRLGIVLLEGCVVRNCTFVGVSLLKSADHELVPHGDGRFSSKAIADMLKIKPPTPHLSGSPPSPAGDG